MSQPTRCSFCARYAVVRCASVDCATWLCGDHALEKISVLEAPPITLRTEPRLLVCSPCRTFEFCVALAASRRAMQRHEMLERAKTTRTKRRGSPSQRAHSWQRAVIWRYEGRGSR